MDNRLNAISAALPRIDPLIQRFITQKFPADVSCKDEELFFDPKNRDVYIALSFDLVFNAVVTTDQLVVRVPLYKSIEVIDSAVLVEKDLEDLTHLIPKAVRQVLKTKYANDKLQAALTMSSLLLHQQQCSV